MSQSAFIAGALLAGFVLYIAAKGRLVTYTAVLWGPTQSALPAGGSGGGSADVGSTVASVGKAVSTAAEIATVIGL